MSARYRLWVSADRCVRVELWPAKDERPEQLLYAERTSPDAVWGPPQTLGEEDTSR